MLARVRTPLLWLQARHLNIGLEGPSLASLEIETMPYPSTHPDPSVFESISDEYSAVATRSKFTPLSSSDTLSSLVIRRDFRTAESLRKEMTAHHIPIPHDARYLHAALHAISPHRQKDPAQAQQRMDAFVAWLSLAPNRHQQWLSFSDIRHRLFCSMDHLNLTLVYRFGLVLASKGYYSGDAAMQVVSTLARYARPSVVERYLRRVEDASQDYDSKRGMDPSLDLLAGAYSLSIRTLALGGRDEAALTLISTARSRGICIPDFTLNMVAKHAPNQQTAVDRIRVAYPSWNVQDITSHPVNIEHKTTLVDHPDDIATLATRLRSLRAAMRSPTPPSPHALHDFITSYQALGRTCALPLLRSLAYRHSPKSASTWAFTEMLHHRSRREFVHVLFVFADHFHLVGVPRKTLLSIVRGPRGKQTRKERGRRWGLSHQVPLNRKLWPSAYHTALLWDAIVSLSTRNEQERLYELLLSLVRRSRESSAGSEQMGTGTGTGVQVEIPADAFDAAHFSPFVSSWSRLGRGRGRGPAKAAQVLRDMMELGVEPTLVQWSMVARGYAQHDDAQVALRILDQMEVMERGRVDGEGMEMRSGSASEGGAPAMGMNKGSGWERGDDAVVEREWTPSDALLGLHTNVLRGFVVAGNVEHAREVERRLVERLRYRGGKRVATDASVAMLRELEARSLVSDVM